MSLGEFALIFSIQFSEFPPYSDASQCLKSNFNCGEKKAPELSSTPVTLEKKAV